MSAPSIGDSHTVIIGIAVIILSLR